MHRKYLKYVLYLPVIIVTGLLTHDTNYRHLPRPDETGYFNFALQEIREKGKIVAATVYNSTDYFVYKGAPMGFQYEMIVAFAHFIGVKPEIKIIKDPGNSFDYLEEGKCDLLAINLSVTKERGDEVHYTEPFCQTRQILVQRKPLNQDTMSMAETEASLVRNQVQLAGKTIYVEKKSAYAKRLRNLSREIGRKIKVVELPYYDTEQLIGLVANGDIDYTICDENTTGIYSFYFPDIDFLTPVSFSQNQAWAVNKSNPELLAVINKWIRDYKNTESFQYTYGKYFRYNKTIFPAQKEFHTKHGGKISIFDDVIVEESAKIGWDWRLLASLIYQESKFIPKSRASDGAYGLMQLMPATARKLGINRNSSPKQNIAAGVKYLKKLMNEFDEVRNKEEQTRFVLAAYNAGPGRIQDAQRLAEKYGKKPVLWNDVAIFLKNLSKPEYYNDPDVKFGYYNGNSALNFVDEVLERYEQYRKKIKD